MIIQDAPTSEANFFPIQLSVMMSTLIINFYPFQYFYFHFYVWLKINYEVYFPLNGFIIWADVLWMLMLREEHVMKFLKIK